MARDYIQRRADRLDRLRKRAAWLQRRIELAKPRELTHDIQERSALLWAVEEIERQEIIAGIVGSPDLTSEDKILELRTLLRARLQPTPADLERTRGLRKQAAVEP